VHNKFTREWDGPPVNFLDLSTLRALCSLVCPQHTVVYIRPKANEKGYAADGNTVQETLGDHSMLRREFPNVLLFQDMLAASPSDDYNSLQLKLHADCQRFVSVQGGNSVVASYFGGTNIVFAVKGPEVRHGTYSSLYPLLSGCRVVHARTHQEVLSRATELFCAEP
jgi:hypothetical protein